MNNIKLKIKNNEVGLRRVGENLYEPKSFDLLLKLIKEEGDNVTLERNYGGSFFKINSFPPKSKKVRTRKIKSFCTVATKNIKEEVALMIFSLRKFHKQPIYVCCDKETRLFLKNERLDDKIKFRLINESQLNKINKQFQRNSCVANEVHNAGAILKKMMVMQWALKIHENTMFLDCDIIVLNSLQSNTLFDIGPEEDNFFFLKPFLGCEYTGDSASYFLTGIYLEDNLGQLFDGKENNLIFTPSFGVGYYDDGSGKKLGHEIQFRTNLEISYVLKNDNRIGLSFSHISNANIGDKNPGVEVISFSYQIPY